MPYLQPSNNITFKQARENQQQISKMNENKSIIPLTWINQFTGTPLEDIAKKYQNNMNVTNSYQFNNECISKLKLIYGESKVRKIQENLNFTFIYEWTPETRVNQLICNVSNILRPFQAVEEHFNAYVKIIKEFHKYGMYKNVNLDFIKYLNSTQELTAISIEPLIKELKEVQSAEADAKTLLNDEWAMKELVNQPNFIGWLVNRTNPEKAYSINVTQSAKKILQPEIDRRIMERKIDGEARRRIYQEQQRLKELEEKQHFEDLVNKRMNELRK